MRGDDAAGKQIRPVSAHPRGTSLATKPTRVKGLIKTRNSKPQTMLLNLKACCTIINTFPELKRGKGKRREKVISLLLIEQVSHKLPRTEC